LSLTRPVPEPLDCRLMNNPTEAFSNRPVECRQLPDYRDAELSPVVPAYLSHKRVTTSLFWLFLLAASLIVNLVPFVEIAPPVWVSIGIVVILLASLLLTGLDARHRGWALREHDLIYQSGVLWQKQVILPFARIQHVETLCGPFERWFGIMRVKCFTAGGHSADLVVEGLDRATAVRVRQYLLEQIREDAPGLDRDEAAAARSLGQAPDRVDDKD